MGILITEKIIRDIKALVKSEGYIYALCMILFEDFHVNPEKLQDMDCQKRLSVKEAALLVGFLVQNKLNLSIPATPQILFELKQKTYELMQALQESCVEPFYRKLKESLKSEVRNESFRAGQKNFFGTGEMLIEPIFYSGTGVYDVQYLDFLVKKYKYDQKWLFENKNFDIEKTKKIAIKIKSILQEKAKKVRLYDLKERLPQFIKDLQKHPKDSCEEHIKEILPMVELHQYVELFFEYIPKDEKNLSIEAIGNAGWKSFYNGLLELFIIRKSEFDADVNIEAFFENFSMEPVNGLNSQFTTIGNFNLINAKPIIQLDDQRFFLPISFLLFEAIYESPFYWMWQEDLPYRVQLSEHRGCVGEEIVYDFLSTVFGTEKVFRSVKILSSKNDRSTKKTNDDTDMDVFCVLGTKALCVQVKSKKLTELARTGNDEALNRDFQMAVQDAYQQGLISRQKVLQKTARFIDGNKNEIKFSEEIDDVYMMVVITENYPSLTHQAHIMLERDEGLPFPIVMTAFDLELVAHYLTDPYDFLYYIRQRIALMDYFRAPEEIAFLGYHLDKKLSKLPQADFCQIDTTWGQLIDRNYYPFKMGFEVTDIGDRIKTRWKNERFESLCRELKSFKEKGMTDIIFHLLDLSGETREDFVNLMMKIKQETISDHKNHNFSMLLDSGSIGMSCVAINSDNMVNLAQELLVACKLRKYQSKSDIWLGFGSLKSSSNMVDMVILDTQKWGHDEAIEVAAKALLKEINYIGDVK